MKIENYKIYNLINFQLINNGISGLLENINPEYEYFRTVNKVEPDFRIIISKSFLIREERDLLKFRFKKRYISWEVEISEYEDGYIELIIVPHLDGISNIFQYFALKSIYIRSLIYYSLIRKGGTLLHSSGVQINNHGYLFVGRPGVFKTSILMDIVRGRKASFIGEENVLIYHGFAYAFPFHFRSLDFRLKYYRYENAPTIFHSYLQVLSLLSKTSINIDVSKKTVIKKIFYIEKGVNFTCSKSSLSELLPKLVKNEMMELDIKCNPRLSAKIDNNHFTEYLSYTKQNETIRQQLVGIFLSSFSKVDFNSVTTPEVYDKNIINELLNVY